MVEVFGAYADEYDRFRPHYPEDLWATLRAGDPVRDVVDLGCGTGRASIELARRGAHVVGVEPDDGMRREARLAAERAGVKLEVVGAPAHATGLAEGSCDLVTAAQSFHWFATKKALTEMARILRASGRLAIWWNERDVLGVPYMEAFEALIKRYNPGYRREYLVRDWSRITDRCARIEANVRGEPARTSGHWNGLARKLEDVEELLKRKNPFYTRRFALYDWRPLLRKWGLFEEARIHTFTYAMPSDLEHFTGYAFTLPFVRNEVDASGQEALRADLRELIRAHHGDDSFDVAFTTKLYLSEKR